MWFSRLNQRKVYGLMIVLLLTCFLFLTAVKIHSVEGNGGWWNSSWPYRKAITINHLKVNADLESFPVLIDVFDADLASKAQFGGADIVFTTEGGSKLSHEIEYFASGHLVAWVNVPNLSSTADTVLYMYYGNLVASNQQSPSAVWDSSYVMVQHLEERGLPKLGWNKYAGNPLLSGIQNGFASVFYDNETAIYHLYCSWGSILHFTSSDGKNWTADVNNPVLSGNGEGVPMVWKEGGTWYMLYRYGSPLVIGLANSTDATHWTRYEGNPVLTGDVGQWDDPSYQLDPWGIVKVGSVYYLWYNTIGSSGALGRCCGLATSTDLKNWTKDPNNPLFVGGRFCPFPFKYQGYYYLLVADYTVSPHGQVELYRDANPTFYPGEREYVGIAMDYGSPGEWDESRFDTPCVLTDTVYRDTYSASNNELWAYYAGKNETGGYDWWTGMCIEHNISEAISKVSAAVFSHTDSTVNRNDGQVQGGVDMNVSGKIDGADGFNGIDGYVKCGDSGSLKGMDALTVEAWLNPNRVGQSGIVSKWNSWTNGTGGSYILWQPSAGNVGWGVVTETSTANFFDTPVVQLGDWCHLVGVYDGSQIRLYMNGSQVGTPKSITGKLASTSDSCYIGRYTTPYMNGTIDEVRISNVSRSAGWISTEYNNQLSPSTFYSVGTEQTQRTKVFIDPPLVEKSPSDAGTTFAVNVTVRDVANLFGFDFNLTWDNSLIRLVSVDYEGPLNQIWGSGQWMMVKNETAFGWYKLVAVSTLSSFNCTGDQPLAKLTFRVEGYRNWKAETMLRFAVVKLSDSQAYPIYAEATDGVYRIDGKRPTVQMTPNVTVCRKYWEGFNVSIETGDASGVNGFAFEIHYNTTLLDYAVGSDVWGDLGAGSITINETAGILSGSVSSSTPISGKHWLLNVTFHDALRRVWRDETKIAGWKNDQNGRAWFYTVNLSYPDHADLRYEESGTNEVAVNELGYVFSPIPGDVNNDGIVDVFDIRIVAYYFGAVPSRPEWAEASKYDLNGDNTIDIFDLIIVAGNYGRKYDC